MSLLGLFGGTFDPIHFGHLRPALEIYQDLPIDEIRWIPSGQPPHRGSPLVSTEYRLNMLRLALQDTAFTIDERELRRSGPSYMVDTLISLKQDYSSKTLVLILGMDAFLGLPNWHRWREILQFCHIVVCARPDSSIPVNGELAEIMAESQVQESQQLQKCSHGLIYIHPVTQLAISATMIRDRCLLGKSPRFLLPDSVADYIEKNRLYQKEV